MMRHLSHFFDPPIFLPIIFLAMRYCLRNTVVMDFYYRLRYMTGHAKITHCYFIGYLPIFASLYPIY